ncbi:hypothetical protein [Herbaspirillum sp. SJZ099]|uniref:hypothetical protein n=1 Tax=Herbaspirillum sp. SJZ099 TaxID=2572916 RepID=UPI001647913F|nr:hypothetical protein [Herbaspirillum sp. SJZ099]
MSKDQAIKRQKDIGGFLSFIEGRAPCFVICWRFRILALMVMRIIVVCGPGIAPPF